MLTKILAFSDSRATRISCGLQSNLVVLDSTRGGMTTLPCYCMAALSQQDRRQIADGLREWFAYETIDPVHKDTIETMIRDSEEGSAEYTSAYYAVVSANASVEGWVDLSAAEFGYCAVELAPWCRDKEESRYRGLGAELRAFAIGRLIRDFRNKIRTRALHESIKTLGNRNEKPNIFDWESVSLEEALSYLRAQRKIRNTFIKGYGWTDKAF